MFSTNESLAGTLRTVITSYNDSAKVEGSFLYGGLLDRCLMKAYGYNPKLIVAYAKAINKNTLNYIITIILLYFVFLWNFKKNIAQKWIHVYKGQKFRVSLVSFDQLQASITPRVLAKINPTAMLKLNQSSQTLQKDCSDLSYNF